ncbi:MAG TPA: alpha-glucan family phosphorylase [Candidatus Bathyarchaeota archaeon]|nr:alpha-glucan family phosphorylase [Candidatus Bathyarchaeota archaeon]
MIRDPVCGMPVRPEKTKFKTEVRGRVYYFCSEYCKRRFFERPRIAYFSMEVGIKSEIPTYSGGLGVLAGDTIRSSADLRVPLTAVTLVSRKGYLKQKLTEEGEQLEYPDEWDPSKYMSLLPQTVRVRIDGREVKVGAWIYEHQSVTGGVVFILFLDTDIEGNEPEDRRITDVLYGGDERYRLKQEIVLGIGGVRMLKALDVNVAKYHMNEGHSSLLTLELLKENDMDEDKVKNLCVFTTHTPVEAAFDKFSYDLVQELLGDEYPLEVLKRHGGQDRLNMTLLALNLSKYTNGVTKEHMEYSRKLFPGYHIMSVTNGVHSYTWTSPYFRHLFDRYIPGWANEPELLVRVGIIPDEELWEAHVKAKEALLKFVKDETGVEMEVDALTLGFARRATSYKRATLIFSEIDKLREVNGLGKIQLIFAGKAHPRDLEGKRTIKEIYKYVRMLKGEIKIVYLENYNMEVAAKLTSGVDVWLNTPLPPLEASGTSGMKAAHNGVINFSVLDGWWIEGCIEGVTGWSIGPPPNERIEETKRREMELEDLYNKLKYLIIPTFYDRRDEWVNMMNNSIGKVAYYFNSHRMIRRYVTEAYLL